MEVVRVIGPNGLTNRVGLFLVPKDSQIKSLCFGNTDRAKLQVNLTQCQLLDLILGLQKLFPEKQPIQIIYFIDLPLDPKKEMIMTKTWILL